MGLLIDKGKYEKKREMAYNFFIERGLTPIQASAVVGNFIQESNLDEKSKGDKGIPGGSRGIAQWNRERLQKLRDIHGYDNSELFGNQLEYVWEEFNTTHKKAFDALKKANTIQDATLAVSQHYEVPNPKFANNDKRINYAVETYNKFNTDSPISSKTPQEEIKDYGDMIRNTLNNVTPEVTNLPEETEKPKFTAEELEAQRVLQERQQQVNALDELFAGQEENIQNLYRQAPQQPQALPQEDLNQTFAQVSNFVESPLFQAGGIVDPAGQYKFPGEITIIPNSNITMKGLEYDIFGIDNLGNVKLMKPDQNYNFPGNVVTEYPLKKDAATLKKLAKNKKA